MHEGGVILEETTPIRIKYHGTSEDKCDLFVDLQ